MSQSFARIAAIALGTAALATAADFWLAMMSDLT